MATEYAALLELVENQFRATASAPFAVTTFGTTETEALERLDAEVQARLSHGARIVQRRLSDKSTHPLARFAGDLAGDPLADDWQKAMKTYREEAENDPDYP